ncbi:hypothetical protein OSB04_025761 [Centaurea solstitialis]|uniref:Uncharacterized protein n=1 Tax=Centaurea solstitialis TaxID=347529 RepID=A0AA38SQA7_9ASTR|nr:hypothetical protein OSB04_025761 [Centaurea solstitialis]
MKVETLSRMVPFFDFPSVERISVDAVKHNFIAMKVDHMKGAVIFGDLISLFNFGFESDILQDHLSVLAVNLNKSRSMIYPSQIKASKLSAMLPSLADIVDKEHKKLLARKSIIEKRKEEQERHLLEMIEEREREEAQALLNDVEKRIKKKGKKPLIEGEKVTKQTLMELALQEQVRKRQEMEKKMQKLIKTMDHFERAKREEAAPLIGAAFQRRLAEEKLLHEREQQLEVELIRRCVAEIPPHVMYALCSKNFWIHGVDYAMFAVGYDLSLKMLRSQASYI